MPKRKWGAVAGNVVIAIFAGALIWLSLSATSGGTGQAATPHKYKDGVDVDDLGTWYNADGKTYPEEVAKDMWWFYSDRKGWEHFWYGIKGDGSERVLPPKEALEEYWGVMKRMNEERRPAPKK